MSGSVEAMTAEELADSIDRRAYQMRGGDGSQFTGRTNQPLALYWSGAGWVAAVRHKPERQHHGEVRVIGTTVLEALRRVSDQLDALGGGSA